MLPLGNIRRSIGNSKDYVSPPLVQVGAEGIGRNNVILAQHSVHRHEFPDWVQRPLHSPIRVLINAIGMR